PARGPHRRPRGHLPAPLLPDAGVQPGRDRGGGRPGVRALLPPAGSHARGLRGLPGRGVDRPRARRRRPRPEGRRADAGPLGPEPHGAGGRHARRLAGAVREGRGLRRARLRALPARGAAGRDRPGDPQVRRDGRSGAPAMKLTRRQFEALVERAVARLPRRFPGKLENIALVVEDWADDQTLAEMEIEPPDTLYGLYRGTDLTRR